MATFDVPGVHLQADLAHGDRKEQILLKLTGKFMDITCAVNPEHTKNIVF